MTTLQNTTFANVGLTSGNAVMRVSFRASDQSLADVLSASNTLSQPNNNVAETSILALPMDKVNDRNTVEASPVNDNSHITQDNKDTISTGEENAVLPSITADLPLPASASASELSISEMEVDSMQANLSNESASDAMNTSEPISVSTDITKTDESTAETTTIDRMLRVFRAPPPGTPIARHQSK
jgi:hypothetical protein